MHMQCNRMKPSAVLLLLLLLLLLHQALAPAAVFSRAIWSAVWMYATSAEPALAPMNLSWS
jgi:hypothetical protein